MSLSGNRNGRPSDPTPYHRFGRDEELLSDREWEDAPDTGRRVALALGPEPLEDARHLLPPIPKLAPSPALPPPGPYPPTEFVIDLMLPRPMALHRITQAFPPEYRSGLGFVRFWVLPSRARNYLPLHEAAADAAVASIALSWDLPALLQVGPQAAQELSGYVEIVAARGLILDSHATPRETPERAALRATRLIAVKEKFARAIEMRLMPQGRPFPARQVWRAAYGIGMTWGHLDLFHWHDHATRRRLFSLNAVSPPGYFLPERAVEGESAAGIALAFELPQCPEPVAVYDRMAVALAYFRQKLGGLPRMPDGRELDGDHLYEERDRLEEAVAEMQVAGITPGTAEAARLF